MDYPDTNQDGLYPWKCSCGRINKKWATECAICYTSWKAGTGHRTEPKEPRVKETYQWETYQNDWEDWDDWSDTSSRTSSQAAWYASGSKTQPKAKKQLGKGKSAKGKKGKGAGKGQSSEQESPFMSDASKLAPWTQMDASAFTPATTLSPNPFATAGHSGLIAEKQEWIEALKKAYPDPNNMPEETKKLVEKTERESMGDKGSKTYIRPAHTLGRSKTTLEKYRITNVPIVPSG